MISGYVTQDVLLETRVGINRPKGGGTLRISRIAPLPKALYRVRRGLDARQLA
jgi:hypothetical protein